MKLIEVKLYSFKELSPEAQDRVIKSKAEAFEDDWTAGEIVASLKAIAATLNLRLKDWSIGAYSRNNRCSVNSDEQGNKALARFARVLQSHKYEIAPRFKDQKFPGVCGFTGVCWDDDLAETIWEALLAGETMNKAFDRCAGKAGEILEAEHDYQTSREGILEYLDQSEEVYTEDGNEF